MDDWGDDDSYEPIDELSRGIGCWFVLSIGAIFWAAVAVAAWFLA